MGGMGPLCLLYPWLAALWIPVQEDGESCWGAGPSGNPSVVSGVRTRRCHEASSWLSLGHLPWLVKQLCFGVTQRTGRPSAGRVGGKMWVPELPPHTWQLTTSWKGFPVLSPWGFGFVTQAVPLGSCHRSHGHELSHVSRAALGAALSLLARSQNRTCKFTCVQPCAQFAAGGLAGGPSAHAGLDRGSRCFAVSSDRQPEHQGAVLCCAVLDATLFCSPPQVL